MFDLNVVGCRATKTGHQHHLNFGIYLPNISPEKGYKLELKLIHQNDQYTPGVEPHVFEMEFSGGSYNLWHLNLTLPVPTESHFGSPGNYLYRYQLLHHNDVAVSWFSDPFARQSGSGTFSAITVGKATKHKWKDNSFKIPHVDDMVVYELMTDEFNQDFDGIIDRLDYLQGIGINVIELMPVTNMKENFRWGYMPLNFLAPEERYGGAEALKRLIDASHQKGIAIILDAVYAHAHTDFAYNHIYNQISEDNPMMGPYAEDAFGEGTDFNKAFTRDYFLSVNKYWIDEFHVDGFRYDYVPGYYDNPVDQGYANLAYQTYQYTMQENIPRFKTAEGYSRVIQCAEHLPDPQGIMRQTYSNSCWQNRLMDKSISMAKHNYVDDHFAHLVTQAFQDYPGEYQNPGNGDRFPVQAFQYIESHDHSRLINEVGSTHTVDILGQPLGDRKQWYKLQPYVIALYTCQGIPMLWNGQEFGENYGVPKHGPGRVFLSRPLHWEYFYDEAGQGLMRLYRKMAKLRQEHEALRSRHSYYQHESSETGEQVIIYNRHGGDDLSIKPVITFLNFSNYDHTIDFNFPHTGQWHELLHEEITIDVGTDTKHQITVPSNYGRIFALK